MSLFFFSFLLKNGAPSISASQRTSHQCRPPIVEGSQKSGQWKINFKTLFASAHSIFLSQPLDCIALSTLEGNSAFNKSSKKYWI